MFLPQLYLERETIGSKAILNLFLKRWSNIGLAVLLRKLQIYPICSCSHFMETNSKCADFSFLLCLQWSRSELSAGGILSLLQEKGIYSCNFNLLCFLPDQFDRSWYPYLWCIPVRRSFWNLIRKFTPMSSASQHCVGRKLGSRHSHRIAQEMHKQNGGISEKKLSEYVI